jgi:hypothetical protein
MDDNQESNDDYSRPGVPISFELIEPLVRGIIESADPNFAIDDSVLKGIMPLAASIFGTELARGENEYDAACALLVFGFFAGFEAGHISGHICAEASEIPDTIDQIWPDDDVW